MIFGALLVAGALPVWDGADSANAGLLLAGIAVALTGIFDHRAFLHTFGPPPMPEPDLALDRLIHEPGRLAILTVLSSASDADFLFVQRATGLTKGNLSSHLTKLEDGGARGDREALRRPQAEHAASR